ncbi:succinate dehydrogenase [Hwanghaeella grinnelliae]|uniref:Succinate dehydrogenase n=1 Tax=Hwanghaeella grinnelliae TaxID=2500179 RepID=A0A437QX18_9PROT|nr:succinate dehydrogenase [Hwanghaeella grinnelliae]RVU39080.1 succinate dehydrogenase [Hwanghaeella grinnelliae]
MTEAALYAAQRVTAMILAPLVLIHLGLILYAVSDGLTADEILSRTRGNMAWAAFYGLFVLSAAVHAPLGLRNILREWLGLRGRMVDCVLVLFAALLAGLGLRAVLAVI